MKITLEFNDNQEEEARIAIDGTKYKNMLDEIWEKIFRPNNKHGYRNKILDEDSAYDVIELLSKKYLEILDE